MNVLKLMLQRFAVSESGATLVEYGIALILAMTVGGTAFATLASDVTSNAQQASLQVNSR
jgi:Flp pilus assembly pilin Flp